MILFLAKGVPSSYTQVLPSREKRERRCVAPSPNWFYHEIRWHSAPLPHSKQRSKSAHRDDCGRYRETLLQGSHLLSLGRARSLARSPANQLLDGLAAHRFVSASRRVIHPSYSFLQTDRQARPTDATEDRYRLLSLTCDRVRPYAL